MKYLKLVALLVGLAAVPATALAVTFSANARNCDANKTMKLCVHDHLYQQQQEPRITTVKPGDTASISCRADNNYDRCQVQVVDDGSDCSGKGFFLSSTPINLFFKRFTASRWAANADGC